MRLGRGKRRTGWTHPASFCCSLSGGGGALAHRRHAPRSVSVFGSLAEGVPRSQRLPPIDLGASNFGIIRIMAFTWKGPALRSADDARE